MSAAPAMDGEDGRVPARTRRIVFAAIFVDEALLESLNGESATDLGAGLASMPLRFVEHAGWWGVAATLGTGASPLRHGVLTAAAIDEDSLSPRLRRATDADRPWIWDRLAAEGRAPVVVGWPGIADARGCRVPFATLPGVMAPRRLANLAEGGMPDDDPPAWREGDAEPMLAQLVSPIEAAATVARAAIAAASSAPADLSDAGAMRMIEMLVATAEALESHADGRGDAPRFWAIGVPLRAEAPEDGDADAEAIDAERERSLERSRSNLAVVLRRLADAAGADGVLLAAVVGTRSGRLWHTTGSSAPLAAAIDLAPTILQLAGLPVSADLPGDSLLGKVEETAKSWDVARWSLPEADAAPGSRRPAAGVLARKALAARAERRSAGEDDTPPAIEALLLRHFEAEWAIALMQPDWETGLAAASALVELHGREIDLWRVAFAAFQGDQPSAADAAAARLRAEHPDGLATRLLPLLSSGSPPSGLVESIDLADLRVPTQRSIVGRAAARLELDEICRKALAPLVAHGLAIPADRIALANTLLKIGEGQRALAALGGFGAGAESAARLRILRAKCLAAAGHRDRAIALLERFLVQAPFDGEARSLRDRLAKGE